jgi:hypothetical protein
MGEERAKTPPLLERILLNSERVNRVGAVLSSMAGRPRRAKGRGAVDLSLNAPPAKPMLDERRS